MLSKILMIFSFFLLTSCSPRFFKSVSASFSKEYCSCRYVVGKDEQYCKNYSRQIIPVFSYKEDNVNKSIKSNAMGFSTVVTYQNKKQGCLIIN